MSRRKRFSPKKPVLNTILLKSYECNADFFNGSFSLFSQELVRLWANLRIPNALFSNSLTFDYISIEEKHLFVASFQTTGGVFLSYRDSEKKCSRHFKLSKSIFFISSTISRLYTVIGLKFVNTSRDCSTFFSVSITTSPCVYKLPHTFGYTSSSQ